MASARKSKNITDPKWKYHISIPEDIIIHDQEKFEILKLFSLEELIEYRREKLRGLNEVAIAIIDPEFYTVARSIGDEAYLLGNKGVLPTQKSMRWREMSNKDVLRLKFQLHPYSSESDLSRNDDIDFPGENDPLMQEMRKRRLAGSKKFTVRRLEEVIFNRVSEIEWFWRTPMSYRLAEMEKLYLANIRLEDYKLF